MPERINGQLTHDIMQELQADKAKINHIKYGKIISIQDGKLVRIKDDEEGK